jgi:hypothetical protein
MCAGQAEDPVEISAGQNWNLDTVANDQGYINIRKLPLKRMTE